MVRNFAERHIVPEIDMIDNYHLSDIAFIFLKTFDFIICFVIFFLLSLYVITCY